MQDLKQFPSHVVLFQGSRKATTAEALEQLAFNLVKQIGFPIFGVRAWAPVVDRKLAPSIGSLTITWNHQIAGEWLDFWVTDQWGRFLNPEATRMIYILEQQGLQGVPVALEGAGVRQLAPSAPSTLIPTDAQFPAHVITLFGNRTNTSPDALAQLAKRLVSNVGPIFAIRTWAPIAPRNYSLSAASFVLTWNKYLMANQMDFWRTDNDGRFYNPNASFIMSHFDDLGLRATAVAVEGTGWREGL